MKRSGMKSFWRPKMAKLNIHAEVAMGTLWTSLGLQNNLLVSALRRQFFGLAQNSVASIPQSDVKRSLQEGFECFLKSQISRCVLTTLNAVELLERQSECDNAYKTSLHRMTSQ